MRIIQTFWTAKGSPYLSTYGWPHPRYNAMSWVLSCLCLQQHFNNIELYTDTAGYQFLIEKLGLPYKEVHVVLDDFSCLPYHWALSKIKVYSMQKKAFVHIDGDVYLPNGLPHSFLTAKLAVQNKEFGTEYYKRMTNGILACEQIHVPAIAQEGICRKSVPSYNMGLFGGTDLDFIHRYCIEAFKFIDENHLNNPRYSHVATNCNIFVEQILLAIMAEREQRDIHCLIKGVFRDNGYSSADFCDFKHFEKRQILHILSGHKRRQENYLMLEKTLLRLFPDYYKKIMALFPENYERGYKEIVNQTRGSSGVHLYDNFIRTASSKWKDIKTEELFYIDCSVSQNLTYYSLPKEEQEKCYLTLCPHLLLFDCENLNTKDKEILKRRLDCEEFFPLNAIAIRPSLTGNRVEEVPLLEEETKTIKKIGTSPAYESEIREWQRKCNTACAEIQNTLFEQTIDTLLYKGLAIINKSITN